MKGDSPLNMKLREMHDDSPDGLWHSLNEQPAAAQQTDWPQHLPTFDAIFQHFKCTTKATVINLQSMTGADREYLAQSGIDSSQLVRNLNKTMNGAYFDSRRFQLSALKYKAIYAICPFTGKQLQSRHSLLANINAVFYRFVGEQVFYVATAGIGSGFRKSALYFPALELIVTAGDEWGFRATT